MSQRVIMARKIYLRTMISIIPFLFLIGTFVYSMDAADTEQPKVAKCDVHHTSCTKALSGSKVTLDITPKPVKAMKDLTFRVTLAGKETSAMPYIDLGMPGMDMGRNRVPLRSLGQGVWEGEGIIVRCPSGRRTWKATVKLPDLGAVEFIFDVIY
jgi:hypothetical protein